MEIGGTKSDLAIDNIDVEDGECKPNAVYAECKTFDGTEQHCHHVDETCLGDGMLFEFLFVIENNGGRFFITKMIKTENLL